MRLWPVSLILVCVAVALIVLFYRDEEPDKVEQGIEATSAPGRTAADPGRTAPAPVMVPSVSGPANFAAQKPGQPDPFAQMRSADAAESAADKAAQLAASQGAPGN